MQDKEIHYRNVLVIDLGHLGDIILSLPALIALREKLGQAKITLLVPSSAEELFKLFPIADELITVDRTRLKSDAKHRSIAAIFRLVADVRRRRFDLVIDLHSLYETNILGFLSGAGKRLFANRENRSLDFLANFRPKPPKQDKGLHLSSYYLNVLNPLDVRSSDILVRILPDRFEGAHLNGFAGANGDSHQKLIGFVVGSGHESRRWKLSNFAALAERLSKEGDARVIVFLGPAERHLEVEVKATFPVNTTVISGIPLLQLAANLSEMSVLVGNDTGPMHLAAISGTPIVLIMDNRAPRTYLPLTESLEVVGGENLDAITVDKVLAATLRIVSESATANEKMLR